MAGRTWTVPGPLCSRIFYVVVERAHRMAKEENGEEDTTVPKFGIDTLRSWTKQMRN